MPGARAAGPRGGARAPAVGHAGSARCPSPSSARPSRRRRWLPGVVAGDVMLTRRPHRAGRRRPARPRSAPPPTATAARGTGAVPACPRGRPRARAGPDRRRRRARRSSTRPRPASPLERAVTTNREISPHLHLRRGARRPTSSPAEPGAPPSRFVVERALVGLCACRSGCRGGAAPDGGVHLNARSQFGRPSQLPGDIAAGGRRRHRHRGHAGHAVAGGLAARHRPRRRRWRSRWPSGGRPRRPAGGARHPAPARRHGRRHHLPDPPLLPLGQADRGHARAAASAQLAARSAAALAGRRDDRCHRPRFEDVAVGDELPDARPSRSPAR